ncbi:FKBP-type peptidyl-prolyl cis-trans isomerase [Geodermatophilus sp. YIM 151500]|uniref:FKBP-type peptidyl-prolyl cis-trans isomerase n=1 Tax=Geodermatophilus sp. YIM 151500 TaxID=2984531 RepID=UPI0021E4EAF2|nr:FKBP-type peptidyl-prolyl cis-trans isomerase [Geodermatophilus sp. YIM 151500]MCV2487756.1 FKBP-type peptidyl-prolyl cis-trans isomerase [Geodermatophilus sp. YIM 151500]
MPRRPVPRALLALTLCALLTACGGDDPGGSASGTAGAPTTAGTPDTASPGGGGGAACETREPTAAPGGEVSTDLAVAPDVPPSDAPPPCDLVVSDVVVGDGAEAVAGSTVAVKYVGGFYETGEEFDSSWSRGPEETLPVTLGAGQVIPGFEQAITGMRVGGRRQVTIPSDLAYGEEGVGPIPGGATLTFVLDLVEVGA